ncbi:MAG: cation transporter [Bauldia sp.]|nr:cation transporter [Bauldia sp.]
MAHTHDDHGHDHDHDDHDHDHHHGHDHDHHAHGHAARSHAGHGHAGHHHGIGAEAGDRQLFVAIAINGLLTLVQIVGGIVAGSLALIADAIHNLSDAVSLVIAYFARRIARRPSNDGMTFGYVRAEVIAALINYTTLIVISVYLVYEGIWRLFDPQGIDGWIVVAGAAIALVIDAWTAWITFRMSKDSVNMRAAFLHNLADAMGSVGVIVAGTVIILFDWRIADALVTLGIAGYILWHVGREIGSVVRILMLGTPPGVEPAAVADALVAIDGIVEAHHIHLWQVDERRNSLEAHLVLRPDAMSRSEPIKRAAKAMLAERFAIGHSTLEVECEGEGCVDAERIGHKVALAH